MERTKLFVSYSHKDREWLERFYQHIAVLERRGLVEPWSDIRTAVGANWETEIDAKLREAKVAVLLISPAFLASEWIWKREMPQIVAHHAAGMELLPLVVRPCAWRLEESLARLQARPTNGRALSLGSESQADSDLSAFVYELAARVGRPPTLCLKGEWNGMYNGTRPIQLTIQEESGDSFVGTMTYPGEGTVTVVKGTVQAADDVVGTQNNDGTSSSNRIAVSFKETAYEREGSSRISFKGEYRAIVASNEMFGEWFTEPSLVGEFKCQRATTPPNDPA